MALWQVVASFVVLICLSETQWQGRSTYMPSPQASGQVFLQSESRVPQVLQRYDSNNPMLALMRFPSQKPVQDPLGVQSKQLLQGPIANLTWSFPKLPEEPVQPEVHFELRHPVPVNSIAAQCRENSVYVEVIEDLFRTGKPLIASGFTLGGCSPVGEDNAAQVLMFESELHDCGSIPKVSLFCEVVTSCVPSLLNGSCFILSCR